ncbi:MAG: hypothetical protein NOF05_12175, partial [Candidatus Accumulibacter phosphatis]|nr:hypothetical protein [Candidatus Accumulibacter phosphatis]
GHLDPTGLLGIRICGDHLIRANGGKIRPMTIGMRTVRFARLFVKGKAGLCGNCSTWSACR